MAGRAGRRRAQFAAAAAALFAAACATLPEVPMRVATGVSRFSESPPGEALPPCWERWQMARFKRATDYWLVSNAGTTVVRADADQSASGLVCRVRVDLGRFPLLRWRWRVPQLIEGADNTLSHVEDSPVRIVVGFAGDHGKLPFDERVFHRQVKATTGHDLPYATLMYIWENRQPVGTVIRSRHTSRIRMIVAESGSARLGEWREEVRNVAQDFRRAFGEEPPEVISIGVMTDTDNTGARVEAFYGDIEFVASAPASR